MALTLTLPKIDELITDASKRSAEYGNNYACRAAINALLTLREATIKLREEMNAPVVCQTEPTSPQHPQLNLHFSHAHSHSPSAP